MARTPAPFRHPTPTAPAIARPPATIDEQDAGVYIGYTPSALRAWRSQGRGPAYIRIGRSIRYRVEDLDDWLNGHLVHTRDSRRGSR